MGLHRQERGFALAVAVFALVVIATLIAGAFFASRQELNIGRNSATYQRAFSAAEAGLGSTVATWNTGTFNNLAVNDTTTVSGTVPNSGGSWSSVVRRLNPDYFLIRVTGSDPAGVSQRQLAMLARLQRVAMEVNAGLTTRGNLVLGGSSYIDGSDANPNGWNCPSTGGNVMPGILTRDSSLISFSGCKNYSCVNGNPKIEQQTSINDSTFFQYGSVDYNTLAGMATLQLPGGQTWTQVQPSVLNGVCNTAGQKNWGEPYRTSSAVTQCTSYYPIIHINGNASFSNGRGQGILLIDGAASIQGGFEFYGPVIVRGDVDTQGTGNHITGGVLAANVNLATSDVLGNATITYSSCAIARALSLSVPARQFARRGWVDLVQ